MTNNSIDKELHQILLSKVGSYKLRELYLSGGLLLDSLPFQAPWLTPGGAGLINITNLRRSNGKIEFQLADESHKPYDNGDAWVLAEDFYNEWPD